MPTPPRALEGRQCMHACHMYAMSYMTQVYLEPSTPRALEGRQCGIRLTLLNVTSSKGYKFKLVNAYINHTGGSVGVHRFAANKAQEMSEGLVTRH